MVVLVNKPALGDLKDNLFRGDPPVLQLMCNSCRVGERKSSTDRLMEICTSGRQFSEDPGRQKFSDDIFRQLGDQSGLLGQGNEDIRR